MQLSSGLTCAFVYVHKFALVSEVFLPIIHISFIHQRFVVTNCFNMSSFGLVSILRRTVQCGANRTTLFRSKTSITPSMSSKQIARAQILNSHFSSICSNNYGYPKSHINDSVTNKTLLFKRFKGKRGLRKSKNQQEEDDEGEEDDDDDDDAG